ncbi:hypothetical protein N3K66_007917 [Trichothecium roseum]|uniref:Uncharacterized protein n=1 Tax=Trichothecium roseum TaxID=47278 RepID=A0ACC0UT54_9HYPO|nr:hypothetical protein N3K66_007917 [Trichothecium roseum]
MSCPSSSGAEFEQQQKQLNEDAEEQVEQGKQILRSLEELRTTQHELINTYIMDAIDKWEALVGHMEAGVSRNPARKAQSKSNILESVLQNTQEKVGALRIQAESLETCAAELYAHSVQLGERAKQLGNKVEDCVAKNLTESTQLIVTWKRGLNQAQVNKKEMNDARDKAFKDRLKASQWETAKDVTKFIPGVNIFAYPLTRQPNEDNKWKPRAASFLGQGATSSPFSSPKATMQSLQSTCPHSSAYSGSSLKHTKQISKL